jgi:RNA-directed DNA polymerase
MKRVGYLYDKLLDICLIRKAFRNALRGKRNKPYAKYIVEHQEELAQKLLDDLRNDRFVPSGPKRRVIREQPRNKEREIAVPKLYPDHIVHWMVCMVLKDVFMKGMYEHNVGCIPGRGCSAGVRYVKKHLKDKDAKYIMKLDIRKYFRHIDHSMMKRVLERKIKDKRMLRLLGAIIDSGGEGLPIGFYSSQWLSNLYLEGIDHMVKERCHVRYYVRNVDDMVMMDGSSVLLHLCLDELSDELPKYNLEVKGDWQVWEADSRPLDFLGYRMWKNRSRMRSKNFYRMMRRVNKVRRLNALKERTARQVSANLAQLAFASNGMAYYLKNIGPIVSKKGISECISLADRAKLHIREIPA